VKSAIAAVMSDRTDLGLSIWRQKDKHAVKRWTVTDSERTTRM